MTVNHGDFSPEAHAAAAGKAKAAGVFAEHAEKIVAALPDVPDEHVLIAVVDENHEFGGTHHVAQTDIVEKVPELEGESGWAMVFTPGTDAEAIRKRTEEMALLARKRGEMISRIQAASRTDTPLVR